MIYLLLIFSLFFVAFSGYIGMPSLIKIFLRRKSLADIDRSQSVVFLTFDDGPDPGATPAILDALRKYDAKATFFVTGKNVTKNREICERILSENHSLGEHGFDHIHPWKSLPVASWREMSKSNEMITEVLRSSGKTKVLYRPPFGKFNLVTLLYSLYMKRKIVFWDIDPNDYASDSPLAVARKVLSEIRPGSLILLHDSRSSLENSDVSITVEALSHILPEAKLRGFQFAAL